MRRAAFDIGMADTQVLDVPVELRLELIAIVSSDLVDAEWELFNDVLHEVDRVGLCELCACECRAEGGSARGDAGCARRLHQTS